MRGEGDDDMMMEGEEEEEEEEDDDNFEEQEVVNLEAFDVPLREWIAQDRTRKEIQRKFRVFLSTFREGDEFNVSGTIYKPVDFWKCFGALLLTSRPTHSNLFPRSHLSPSCLYFKSLMTRPLQGWMRPS